MTRNVKALVIAAVAALLLVVLVVGTALAQGPAPWNARPWGYGGMMGGYGHGGMMGGTYGPGPWNQGAPGRGRTGNWGWGMMGPGGWGPGMMGGSSCPLWDYGPATGEPLSADEAQEIAEQAVASYGNADLEIAEIMQFSRNFYVLVKEESTGKGAFELLIDAYTGAVHPEPGPNMMWNTKYGHMGGYGMMGMMGGWFGPSSGEMTITAEEAVAAAQQWLDANLPGTTASDDDVVEFYGYYTLHTLQDGEITGMLSVNGYTGQVWYHNWHGDFIATTGEHAEQ